MANNFHSKVMQIYEKIRQEEEAALSGRKAEVYSAIPEVKTIEDEIASLSLKLALLHVREKDNLTEKIKDIKNEIALLKSKKLSLMKEKGYPNNYLFMKYRCRKCQDTGYVDGKHCSCYKNKLSNEYYGVSEFSSQLDKYNFSNFNIDIFENNEASKINGKTPRSNMKSIFEKSFDYIERFPLVKDNMLFMGPSGTGKTYLATSIAKALMDEGHFVIYRTADRLIEDLKEIKFRDNLTLEDYILNSDLLIIDDLGTELSSEFSQSEIFNLINRRLLKDKKMIISTNLTLEDIQSRYSERLFSRFMGEFDLIKFYGSDLRILMKLNEKKIKK